MRILITGGCGFIGSHLINFHLNKGNEVTVVDDLSSGNLNNIAPFLPKESFRFYQADLLSWPELAEAINWADRIYHFSAIVGIFRVLADPLRVMEVNLNGTYHLLNSIAKSTARPTVILASSSSVYGHSKRPSVSEEDDLIIESFNPLKTYAVSKLSSETLAMAFHQKYGLPITIVRFFNIIGPHQTGRYGMVVPRFIHQACSNIPLTVFGNGRQTRSFCDVRDAITSLELLNLDSKTLNIINIGNDHEIRIKDLAKLVIKIADSKSKIKYFSYREAYGREYKDTARRRPNIQKLKQLTAYDFQWSLEETLKNLINLYRANG